MLLSWNGRGRGGSAVHSDQRVLVLFDGGLFGARRCRLGASRRRRRRLLVQSQRLVGRAVVVRVDARQRGAVAVVHLGIAHSAGLKRQRSSK